MRRTVALPSILLFLVVVWLPISAQGVPFVPMADAGQAEDQEYLLKSVFIERFTRFVEWPDGALADDADTPFVIGVIGAIPFGEMLETLYATHRIKNHPVTVRFLDGPDQADTCNVLFIGHMEQDHLDQVLDAVRLLPVLTVADTDGYAEKGVHINMYVAEDQIRFEINKLAATEAGLHISYLLLKVASIVEPKGAE